MRQGPTMKRGCQVAAMMVRRRSEKRLRDSHLTVPRPHTSLPITLLLSTLFKPNPPDTFPASTWQQTDDSHMQKVQSN